MNMKRLLFLVCLTFLLFACKNRKQANESLVEDIPAPMEMDSTTVEAIQVSPTDTLLYYRKTPCFGRCPSFELIVYQNHSARYEGQNFVNRIGLYTATVEDSFIEAVIEEAEKSDYFSLKDSYDNRFVSDLPATITEIQSKRVYNRYEGPNLKNLYARLDTLIENTPWILKSQSNE